jgi:hypothetical protein
VRVDERIGVAPLVSESKEPSLTDVLGEEGKRAFLR